MKPAPARLHVLLASKSNKAVVIRRGPSNQVATILWDRKVDSFEVGQWMKGRIYERRSDLSPTGDYMIYFARQIVGRSGKVKFWTAISRAPYLKAMVRYPKGDAWRGGGLWTGKNSYWLNDRRCWLRGFRREVTQVRQSPYESVYGDECPGVYFHRLTRDGWSMTCSREHGRNWASGVLFEKPMPNDWTLTKRFFEGGKEGQPAYWEDHIVRNTRTGAVCPKPSWEWADADGSNLLWASNGKLYRGRCGKTGLIDERLLMDFNTLRFEARVAPY